MELNKSKELFLRAQNVIPGGVNSPVRAFKGVGGIPPFIQKAKGAYVWDIDGNQQRGGDESSKHEEDHG